MMSKRLCFLLLWLVSYWDVLLAGAALAGEVDVLDVNVQHTAANTYRFDVTVLHDDSGWDHYADRWEVLSPDGNVLGTRTLLHPHEHEQPFTRSLSGLRIPIEIKTVTVRAHDSVHGYGRASVTLTLPQDADNKPIGN